MNNTIVAPLSTFGKYSSVTASIHWVLLTTEFGYHDISTIQDGLIDGTVMILGLVNAD